MKQLIATAVLIMLLISCDGDKTPTASDFSGKLFNAAYSETSPFLNGLSVRERSKLSIQYVFNMDGTGAMRIMMNEQSQSLAYRWLINDAALVFRFNNGEDKYAIKRAGSGYELENKKHKIFLFKAK